MEASQLEELLRTDITLLLVAAIAAGVFEEICKPIGLLLFKSKLKSAGASIGWIVGVGAGLLEALNFIGGELYRVLALKQATFNQVQSVPLERFLMILFHGALSSILVYSVMRRRYLIGLTIPIIIHFAIDFLMPYVQLQKMITGVWKLQLITFAWVILASVFPIRAILNEAVDMKHTRIP